MRLCSREAELARMTDLLEVVCSGRSGALLVRSDAGMGKTVLLAEVTAHARAEGVRTRELRGVAGEADFGFAALQRLLIPFMDGYGELPGPQRQALGAAIGLTDAGTPDRFLIGLATLTLLAETEPDRPKLIVIDDAHWLDRESLDTLVFVARRIQAESLAIVFAARPEGAAASSFDGIASVDLGPFSVAATTELLAVTTGAVVDPEVGCRVAAGTQGCPLAVVELARDLSPGQLAGVIPLPDPLPIGGRLEELYLERVRALPAPTQQMLLIAAAATGAAHLATVVAAGALAGLSGDALDRAQDDGLVDVTATVTFRHPLVRSAVYRGAAPAGRRRAHALLAQVTDPDAEPDAWVWHRARAVTGTDAEVASALEARGLEAERRGRYAARAALMSRAAELTSDPRDHARRTQAAADAFLVAGAPGEAAALLEQVRVEDAEPLVRAHAQRLHAALTYITRPADALATLVETAQSLEALDPELSRMTYAEALFMATTASHLAPPGLVERLATAALASLDPGESSIFADVIRALAERLLGGFARAVPAMRTALASLMQPNLPSAFTLWIGVGGMLAVELLDLETYRRFTSRLVAEQRARGAPEPLRFTLTGQAQYEFWDGRFDAAAALFAEAGEISRSIGDSSIVWSLVLNHEFRVWRDDEATSRANFETVHSLALSEVRAGYWDDSSRHALAILENSLGNYAAALAAVRPVFERDLIPGGRILVEIVEAAHRSGSDDLAAAALARLGARSQACGTAWAAGLHARSRGVVAGDDAEQHFQHALSVLAPLPVRTDVARTHLLYGEWLRRQGRRKDARVQLATAHDAFTEMGARHFAARAARELTATGATVRRRTSGTVSEPLTPQEQAIARLAAGPATNREIAAGLFLSASTVDYHLRKVYRKLGVDSRRKLAAALDDH
ncbi:AAA family ATPase [Cellulomonas dongxiuzhuiae]|uniref:AAA family ATPase n=1 Tax=Cellulomonas dongxiuzhuiae TaxID=2819979 RepID=UPI001AAE8B72|nr:AAA family ATPase [Cellulomonas dongxiuzhuiae]MBO3088834.1 AAA family ATPase [Cellulomonas dongxiuzhuiae]